MMLGAALPLVAGAAALPIAGEAAIAAGAPALATRAVTGVAGGAMFGRMGAPAAMVAREAAYQTRSAAEGNQPAAPAPAPQANPALDQLLANNDLTPFPNIQRALQESGGMRQLQHAFGSLNGQPLHPEYNAGQKPVDPQSLLQPEALTAPIEDGVTMEDANF